MKNFVRLVRFAWPYKTRFALSVGCAAMVALLFFTELGAVYPLLHILFDSQNPRAWINQRIEKSDESIRILEARKAEAQAVISAGRGADADRKALEARYQTVHGQLEELEKGLRGWEARIGFSALHDARTAPSETELEGLERLRGEHRLALARVKELSDCGALLKQGEIPSLERRPLDLDGDIKHELKWKWRYQLAKPYIDRYLPGDPFTTLVLLLGLVMVGVAIKGCFVFFQETLVADVMQLTLFDIRNRFFRRTINLDLASFSSQGSSELLARFTNDMESFGQGLSTLMSKLVREPMRVTVCLCGALWFNWRLTCLTLVLVPISATATYRVGKVMKRAVRRSLESMSSIYKILQETFQGMKVVKSFAMERVERRRFFRETKNLYKKSVKVAMIDATSDPVLELLSLTTVAIALLAGSYLVLNRTIYLNLGFAQLQLASSPMVIQDLLTLYAMLGAVSDPIRKLANVHSKIQRASAAADRICGLMDRRPIIHDRATAQPAPRHRDRIELDDVVFGYNPAEPVLKGISLTVDHGETIALVGPNGCGKTTLMNLLPRFWDVNSGAIRIDGQDIRELQIRTLRRQIGIVLQETILFQDTIAANIAYGNPGASRKAVIEAAERSFAHGFISALPQGYDTVIGERGLGLSGGQRQRIALARAMLCDPAILILDEATSAVDIQDEALIRKAIAEFARGRTTFLISHNLATIQSVDRIVLMRDGRIEGIGTDQELRRTSALYRKLNQIHYQNADVDLIRPATPRYQVDSPDPNRNPATDRHTHLPSHAPRAHN